MVGLGISGKFRLGIGVGHGWIPIGLPMKATKSVGPLLQELDGKPAISVYEEFFGEKEVSAMKHQTLAKLSVTYPLGIPIPDLEEMLIRDPLTVHDDGSITCAGDILEGSVVRLMIGSRESALQMAKRAAEDSLEGLDGAPVRAILIFDGVGRNKLFGERAGEEITAIQEILGANIPLLGFYTYGEQAPLRVRERVQNVEKTATVFQNESVVIVALGD